MNFYLSIISFLALVFSILAFFSCNTNASIEGGALALISICATLIVGVHILDAVKMKQLEDKMEELSKTKEELEKVKVNANIALNITWGLLFLESNHLDSFKHFALAYQYAISENDAKRVNTCNQCLQRCVDKVKRKSKQEQEQFKKDVQNRILKGKNKFNEDALHEIEKFLDKLNKD